jgi:hypothetical protein
MGDAFILVKELDAFKDVCRASNNGWNEKPDALAKIYFSACRKTFPIHFSPVNCAHYKAGKRVADHNREAFFTANIRKKNTRMAYARAVSAFLGWREEHGFAFDDIEAVTVSAYIEQFLADGMAKPSVKQHLAAMLSRYRMSTVTELMVERGV